MNLSRVHHQRVTLTMILENMLEVATVASEEEMEMALSGPAIYSNKVLINAGAGGVKLTFAETQAEGKKSYFRSAVMLSYQDAINLWKVLREQLKIPEEQIEKAKEAESAANG